jgi:hypothetical protein
MKKYVIESAERYPTMAYELRGITYVPHYALEGYAYPGITINDPPISQDKLALAGAKPIELMLYEAYGRNTK